MTILKNLQMETESLIVRDWHELDHGAGTKITELSLLLCRVLNSPGGCQYATHPPIDILPESYTTTSQNLITRIPLLKILMPHHELYLLLCRGKVDDKNVGEH